MKTFDLPETPKCKVMYIKDTVLYSTVITTPHSNDELQRVMLTRQVGMSQVQGLEPIQPPRELHRPHPAQHRMVQYAASAEC